VVIVVENIFVDILARVIVLAKLLDLLGLCSLVRKKQKDNSQKGFLVVDEVFVEVK